MNYRPVENTVFLGNGFSRSIFQDMPSWGDLFEQNDSTIKNYTILYEISRLNTAKNDCGEEEIKTGLIRRIKATFSLDNIRHDIIDLCKFGEQLFHHNVNNIITTNYDNGIEFILCHICGYTERKNKEMIPERIYSIRTHKVLVNEKTGHCVRLWKIHGELERIKSVTLGFDQYCGTLSKLIAYVKGNYNSSSNKNAECKVSMKDKCLTQKFDDLSWAELFFRTNIYIVGFGMDFSEIDIWWLLNKRARFMLEIPTIRNTITYLYNPIYENEENKPDIFAALRAFNVSYTSMESDSNYINNIFMNML